MIVISNTTLIISLASIQSIDLLRQLFGTVIVPQAVYEEIKTKEAGIIRQIKPLMDEMIARGRWYSPNVYENFLRKIGEI